MKFFDVAALYIHDVKNQLMQLALRAKEHADRPSEEMALDSASILTNLLTLYKQESGLLRLQVDARSPEDLARELARSWQALTDVALHLDLSQSPPFWFYDEHLLRLALNNILHNALPQARQHITLRVYVQDEELVWEISDDGPGFPDSVLNLLDAAQPLPLPEHLHGSGLGLYLARTIAEAHENHGRQGHIELVNQPEGRGATFRCFLP